VKGMNYRTQKEYIENCINEIKSIDDKATMYGRLYSLENELKATARQFGGHHMGVGKACQEGIATARQLQGI